jgi:hypothetical protein
MDFRTRRESPFGPDQLSDLFEAAAAQAPSLVILENIDKLGEGEPEEMRQAVKRAPLMHGRIVHRRRRDRSGDRQ